ncbi:MAG: Asp-tRNA(Asn)/Glu-tRNA(Gln) amidotransferase subunit GatA [Nanoarchaeota archaeon]
MPVVEKVKLIHNGELGPTENLKAFLDRIKKLDKEINSFIYINEEKAFEQAEKVEKELKEGTKKPLSGIVVGIKSNISVEDYLVSAASKTLENYYGTYDAEVVKKLKDNGAIIVGMLNMDEFACGSSGETSYYGPTKNPRDLSLIPGGSSSGSATAVAANLVDFSLGSDTGGSIRNPSSHCGVYGLKPSYGRVSRFGLLDLAMSLDQIGPITKSIEDLALITQIIAGKSDLDQTTADIEVPDYLEELKKEENLTFGFIKGIENFIMDEEIKKVYLELKEKIKNKFKTKEIEIKHLDLSIATYYPIVYVEFFSATRKYDGRKYGYKIEETAGEEVLRRIKGGEILTKAEFQGQYYRKALVARKLIAKEFKEVFKEVDIIILPTTPKKPHKIEEKLSPLEMYAYDLFTIPANLAGIAASVLPIKETIGIQIYTNAFKEEKLFKAMKKIEELVKNNY